MKLTITTLTGEKFEVQTKAEDKVKDVKVSSGSGGTGGPYPLYV